jgi:hypothetical protein
MNFSTMVSQKGSDVFTKNFIGTGPTPTATSMMSATVRAMQAEVK